MKGYIFHADISMLPISFVNFLLFAFVVLMSAHSSGASQSISSILNNQGRELQAIKTTMEDFFSSSNGCEVESLPSQGTSCDCIPRNENEPLCPAVAACLDYIIGMTGYLDEFYELIVEYTSSQPSGEHVELVQSLNVSLREFEKTFKSQMAPYRQQQNRSWPYMSCNGENVTYTPVASTKLSVSCDSEDDCSAESILAVSLQNWLSTMTVSYEKLLVRPSRRLTEDIITCDSGNREERSNNKSSEKGKGGKTKKDKKCKNKKKKEAARRRKEEKRRRKAERKAQKVLERRLQKEAKAEMRRNSKNANRKKKTGRESNE
ncbi:hypothetical protein BSL78_25609 [Apostichopus japonicus]|uniref:Uncharacterized protein n=1 Tax=Stichopus japonicus TaxID=307972 RepID=A0A2G8JP66_STIJA|nr:hypothetical protein BSL78_25609 [Apostichopus japonicus]